MLNTQCIPGIIECGTDEAGRGCLAGPVTAAAVILPHDYHNPLLNDSKKLSHTKREFLREEIMNEAISFHIVHVMMDEIDKINILQASITGMHRSIDGLSLSPEHIVVDGNKFRPYKEIAHTCVIKGDGKYQNIAAASILAKTTRDHYMLDLHIKYPEYGWDSNKGYPTKAHRQAIREHGPTKYHRRSFKLLPEQLEITF